MKNVAVLFLVLLLTGCATMDLPKTSLLPVPAPTINVLPSLGLTRREVTALMTRPVTVGYRMDPATGQAKPITANSLYATEIVTARGETYIVDEYIAGDAGAVKGSVEDRLVPMIFRKDLLVGNSRAALDELNAKQK